MDILTTVLASMRTGRPAAVRTEAQAPWGLRFRQIAGAGFHVVLHGTCWLIAPEGAPQHTPIALSPGDVVFLRSGRGHILADDPGSPVEDFKPEHREQSSPIGTIRIAGRGGPRVSLLCGAYQLDLAGPHPLLRDLPEIVHLPARHGRRSTLSSTIDLLGAELEDPRPGSDGIIAALIDALLLYVLRAWLDDQPQATPEGWAAALTDPAIAVALLAIHREPAHGWTVETLGRQASMSRAAFARRFTALVGEPPLAYLTRWRMIVAAQLLRDTDATLSAIAVRTGYASEYAVGKAFKRAYGMPPSAYRNDRSRAVPETPDVDWAASP